MNNPCKCKIDLINEIASDAVPSEKQFQLWTDMTIASLPEKLKNQIHDTEIAVLIVDEKKSAELNETYRHKTGATNVLSFPAQKIPGMNLDLLGDLAICAAVVEKEAVEQHKKCESHWAHMTVHGILHLLGYDHIAEDEAQVMESLEIIILKKLGYDNPYL